MPRLSSLNFFSRENSTTIATTDALRVRGATVHARFEQSGQTGIGIVGPGSQPGIKMDSIMWVVVAGTPEGAVAAPVGSMATRSDGGASTTLYVKESGTGNTGWVAK